MATAIAAVTTNTRLLHGCLVFRSPRLELTWLHEDQVSRSRARRGPSLARLLHSQRYAVSQPWYLPPYTRRSCSSIAKRPAWRRSILTRAEAPISCYRVPSASSDIIIQLVCKIRTVNLGVCRTAIWSLDGAECGLRYVVEQECVRDPMDTIRYGTSSGRAADRF